jgi:polygalacturonase
MRRRDFLSAAFSVAVIGPRRTWGQQSVAEKNITDYGAKAGSKRLNTEPIQRAVADVARAGGGKVLVPAGTFLTGKIELLSGVTLYLDAGATLLGSKSLKDYEEGGSGDHEKHLIFSLNAVNVGIAGPGRIDGQGPSFWEPSGAAEKPPDQQWAAVASHKLKPKSSGHPSPMVLFRNCRGVRIEDVQLENSPGWTLHAFNCDDVEIHGISIKNPVDGPNTDGIDLTGCQDVTVSNSSIQTGDDAICLKSTNPYGGEARLVRNVKVTNCSLSTCCNGFKIGTESKGGFEEITFSDSHIFSGDVPFGERVISGVALEVVDGGWIDGVEVSGIKMERVRAPLFIRMGDRRSSGENARHGLRNVNLRDVQAADALMASCITGLPGVDVQNISLSHFQAGNVLPRKAEWVGRSIPEKPDGYPEVWMFGMLPASGFYARHVRGMQLESVDLSATASEARPTLILEDVSNARIGKLTSTPVSGAMPVVQLIGSRDVEIADSSAPAGTQVYLGVEGGNSTGIVLSGDSLQNASNPVKTSDGASPDAVTSVKRETAPE